MQEKKFKSYYVVWKQKSVDEKEIIEIKFKSYYVVWKQKNKVVTNFVRFCLNRTM